jgi:hypothetical protein
LKGGIKIIVGECLNSGLKFPGFFWIIERTLRVIEMKKFNEELTGMVGKGVRI